MSDPQLFDPGLQPERTQLAWRRTTLAVLAGSLLAVRLLPIRLGPWGLAPGLAGIAVAVLIWLLAQHRANRIDRALLHDGSTLPGGGLLLLLTALTTSGATLGLIFVLSS